jgi:hypothetical protein
LNAQAKAREDRVTDQLSSYDREIANLVAQARMVASQADALEGLDPDQKQQLKDIKQAIETKRMEKEAYSQAYMPAYVLQKVNKVKTTVEQARIKKLIEDEKKIEKFLRNSGLNYKNMRLGIDNTTFSMDSTTTDADKVMNKWDDYPE